MKKRFKAAPILEQLAAIRTAIPHHLRPATPRPRKNDEGARGTFTGGTLTEDDIETFEMEAVADGLESLMSELSESLDAAQERLAKQAMEIYYAAEELAKDPAHADLIPHVEAMREAYEKDHGHPIPPRPKKD